MRWETIVISIMDVVVEYNAKSDIAFGNTVQGSKIGMALGNRFLE